MGLLACSDGRSCAGDHAVQAPDAAPGPDSQALRNPPGRLQQHGSEPCATSPVPGTAPLDQTLRETWLLQGASQLRDSDHLVESHYPLPPEWVFGTGWRLEQP